MSLISYIGTVLISGACIIKSIKIFRLPKDDEKRNNVTATLFFVFGIIGFVLGIKFY